MRYRSLALDAKFVCDIEERQSKHETMRWMHLQISEFLDTNANVIVTLEKLYHSIALFMENDDLYAAACYLLEVPYKAPNNNRDWLPYYNELTTNPRFDMERKNEMYLRRLDKRIVEGGIDPKEGKRLQLHLVCT